MTDGGAPARNKSEKRQRTESLYVRVTPAEKAAFLDRADRAGMAAAAFMRAAALGEAGPRAQRRTPVDHAALRQLLGELGRVGSNINQIARHLNQGLDADLPELRECLGAYLELRTAILTALGKDSAHDYQGQEPGRA